MSAQRNIYFVLALSVVACSSASSREPFQLEKDDSVKMPPFGGTASAAPQSAAAKKDKEATAPAEEAQEPAPPPECPTEEEPNNDPEQATEFTRCITGELTSWTDNDYLKIKAPADVSDMIIDHIETGGAVQYSISTPRTGGAGGSSSFNMSFTDQAPRTKITPGQTYLFSLKWDNNGQGAVSDERPYMVRVTFE